MFSAWKSVPNASPRGRYMIRYKIEAQSYHVQLSDLEQIWEEYLDRRKIIQRALNDETSIDPSEDSSQLRVLLEKIESALNRDEGCSLSLTQSKGHTEWVIDLSSPLPEPLEPLKWHVYLQPASASAVRDEITLPLLRDAYLRSTQITDLCDKLKAKDHVITKLIDGLETAGMGLGSVFLQAVGHGSRKVTRDMVAQRVPGLEVFQLEQWRSEVAVQVEENGWTQMMSVISNEPGRLAQPSISPTPAKAAPERSKKPQPPQPQSPASSSTASREATPPASSPPVPVRTKGPDNSTSAPSDPKTAPTLPRKRLGRIGGASKPVPTPQPLSPTTSPLKNGTASPEPTSTQNSSVPATPKKKLGHIGGKPKTMPGLSTSARDTLDPRPIDNDAVEAANDQDEKSSLTNDKHEQGKDETQGHEGSEAEVEEKEKEEETTQQRADRRREELKKELESKRAAQGTGGGVKKKRKF